MCATRAAGPTRRSCGNRLAQLAQLAQPIFDHRRDDKTVGAETRVTGAGRPKSGQGVSAVSASDLPVSPRGCAVHPHVKFPAFPPFPPVIWRPWPSRVPAACVMPAADDKRDVALEASMLMNIMPILSRRRSTGIRHNIAHICQAEGENISRMASMAQPCTLAVFTKNRVNPPYAAARLAADRVAAEPGPRTIPYVPTTPAHVAEHQP